MKHWIENRKVLAAFSDPAGAKAVLAYLNTYGLCTSHATVISDRVYDFYKDFGYEVRPAEERLASEWMDDAEVLIAGTSYPANLEFELVEAAIKARIPSISFVDHWTNLSLRYERNGRRVLPDVIGLVNEQAREQAVSEGLPSEKLEVVGNPYHEYLKSWRPQVPREKLLVSMGLNPHKPYVLYAPEPFSKFGLKAQYGFDEIDGLHLLLEAKKALRSGAFSLVIKGHPNQNHQLFEYELNMLSDQDSVYLSDGDFNLVSFYAEVVVGFFSNAIVEATLLGRPIIRPLILLKHAAFDPLKSMSDEKWINVFTMNDFINALKKKITIV